MSDELVQVTTTVPSEVVASAIADALVRAHLAACVQVLGPIRSRFWWDGAIEDATEFVCVAKTTAAKADAACVAIREHHPYDVPEVLVTPVTGGTADYATWVVSQVTMRP